MSAAVPGTLGRLASAALVLALLAPTRVAAQIADASAVTLGLAGNGVATARGLAALSRNPAGLGMPGPGFSLALLPVQLRAGLHPITLADLAEWEGRELPHAVAEEWLVRATENGAQSGDAGVDVTELALTAGGFGLQLSTIAVTSMRLDPDVLELLLFGNAGRTGVPADLTLGGSEATGFVVSTGSASLGIPLTLAGGTMAFGATLKYSVGHVLAAGLEQPGVSSGDSIEVAFPSVVTAEDADDWQNGSGVGLDVGFQLERGAFGLGVTVLNVVNTFEWEEDKLAFREGTLFFSADDVETEFDEQPFANAPDTLVDVVDGLGFKPIVAVGASYRSGSFLSLTADVRKRLGGGLAREPELHVGAGVEYTGFQGFDLRGGVAAITGGVQLAAGTTLILGPVNLSLSGALRRGDADANLGQLTLSFGGR
jgi:hypothetical protein